MTLTAVQRKRLAREARKLAMDALEGRAEFGPLYVPRGNLPACPLGQLLMEHVEDKLAGLGMDGWLDVFGVSMNLPPSDSYTFPLLALADALEEAPGAAP